MMTRRTRGLKQCLLAGVLLLLTGGNVFGATFPSIYWNPWNPLFSSEEPTINVRIGDTVNFLCPSDGYHFYMPYSHVSSVYENLHFLNDNEEKYLTCNATGTRRLLRCDDKDSSLKIYTISFRDIQTSRDSIKFVRGKDYFLIGTGFRSTDRLDDQVNGSCLDSGDQEGQYKLRLRVHICADDDKCDVCQSDACYYEKNGAKCSGWKAHPLNDDCPAIEKRICTYPLISKFPRTEYRPRTKFNKTKCEEMRNVIVDKNGTASSTKGTLIQNEEDYKLLFYIALPILGAVILLLLLCLCLRTRASKDVTKTLCRCFYVGVKTKKGNDEESVKLSTSGDNTDAEAARPRTEVVSDFFMDVNGHKTRPKDLLVPNNGTTKGDDIDTSKKLDNISNVCEELLTLASDELVKTKARLLMDLLRDLKGDPSIDDPDGRKRVGSDNLAYRNSMNTLPKKKSLRSSPS